MGGCTSNNKGKPSIPTQQKKQQTPQAVKQIKKLSPEEYHLYLLKS